MRTFPKQVLTCTVDTPAPVWHSNVHVPYTAGESPAPSPPPPQSPPLSLQAELGSPSLSHTLWSTAPVLGHADLFPSSLEMSSRPRALTDRFSHLAHSNFKSRSQRWL